MIGNIAFSPAVPVPLLVALVALGVGLLIYGAIKGARGIAMRAIPLLALAIAIADPALVRETRTPLKDVAVVVVDDTDSQKLGQRQARANEAAEKLASNLKNETDLEIRTVHVNSAAGTDGTRLFTALNNALSDVPAQRLAGTVFVTDGQVHDAPPLATAETAKAPWLSAPMHVLLTGERNEHDRRIKIERAPDFGLVGQQALVRLKVEDTGAAPGEDAPITIRRAGAPPREISLPIGEAIDVPVDINNAGANVFEMSVAPRKDELTAANNITLLSVTGVRDRLRVLLISGQPHVGERAWRNLLKSDPNVDLVHFTILRPLNKDDGTPLNELSLIAFPIRELFEERLKDFDLVIFDRYSRRGLVPFQFMSNVANYVREGGAMMLAVGPEYSDNFSLYDSPLQNVLPAAPTGQVSTEPFTPHISRVGERHPVTADLEGTGPNAIANDAHIPGWGRWLRQVQVGAANGATVMTGLNEQPLLVLDRVGKGRVALMLSDTMWLWGKDFDNGGPQVELLRRVSHWLMREPELEEEALLGEARDRTLVVTRRSLETAEKNVTVTAPSGAEQVVTPTDDGHGHFTARMTVTEPGLYRLTDGKLTSVAAVGSPNPMETYDVVTTEEKLAPLVQASGGGTYWLADNGTPGVRRVAPGRTAHGATWLGLKANNQSVVTGVDQTSLAPVALVLLIIMAGAMLAWWREGH